jgi:hypothetical protein
VTTRDARGNAKSTTVDIERNTYAAVVFDVDVLDDGDIARVDATHRRRSKTHCADSESRFLAIKKFSCEPASRLIGARQNRFFTGLGAADSRAAFRLMIDRRA